MQDSIVEKFSAEDVAVFGIAPNETPLDWLKSYVAERNLTMETLYHADATFETYGVTNHPTYVLINKSGQIVERRDGYYYFPEISKLIQKIQQLIDE